MTLGDIRLQKFLARAGIASRRAAEDLIRQRRVTVNGVTAELGSSVDPARDIVLLDGNAVRVVEKRLYIAFHKPRDCITTASDPQGRKTVFEYLPALDVRVFPVGRLDYDAEGLLLLTNDGELANRLLHPRYGVSKVYEVKVKGRPNDHVLNRLRSGIDLQEGRTAPAGVEVIRNLPTSTWLRMVLHQGWNRQIKRMGEAVGHPVSRIKRIAYGPVRLDTLKPAAYRFLTSEELRRIHDEVGLIRSS